MRALNAAAAAAAAVLLLAELLCAVPATQTARKSSTQSPGWLGWGGPRRNFTSDSKGLADTWPPDGPKRLWSRPLGEGHSSIIGEWVGAGEGRTVGRLIRCTGPRPVSGIRGKPRRS